MSRALDGKSFLNISATTAAFTLDGGTYSADFMATWGGGSVALQKLAADGSTYITVTSASWTVNDTAIVMLPAGTYRFAVTTATAVYVNIRRVPGE